MNWIKSDDEGGLKCRIESDTQFREANVHLGGNGLWTARIEQYRFGRFKKNSPMNRTKSVIVKSDMRRPQTQTREEGVAWCESRWNEYPPI